ncbi:hypothetical protein [Halovivax limisalsi]|uniref:hypothetical protein n=1 Tax=Halovivax limisalsi TaxID=1453760 RepID=UPI001FFD5CE8|nr:hypothetical protein [Halovivax limisalsi]
MDGDNSGEVGNGASVASINPHLGGKDIRFLQAIQEVNGRAGYKPGTDERPPATTGKIASAADLNKNEVNYRFNQRGFDTDGLGYIRVYGSELLPNGALSAKCAELTEKGEEALSDVLAGAASGSFKPDEDLEDRLAELEAGFEAMREENEALRETIHQFVERDMGAWSTDREEQFDAILNAMVAYQRIFSEVFGIDASGFRGDGTPPEEMVSEPREFLHKSTNGSPDC